MSMGISTSDVYEDLRITNDFADEFAYGRDAQGNLSIEHYGDDGEITGTQTLTITVGEFKQVSA